MAAEATFDATFSPLPANEGVSEFPGPPVSNTQNSAGSSGHLSRRNGHFAVAPTGVVNIKAAPGVAKNKLILISVRPP